MVHCDAVMQGGTLYSNVWHASPVCRMQMTAEVPTAYLDLYLIHNDRVMVPESICNVYRSKLAIAGFMR